MTIYIWGWNELAVRIRTGDVVTDLQRPVDFQGNWLSQDLGRALYHALFRGLPPFVVGALVFRLHLPSHPWTVAAFMLSLLLAVCISFAIRFLVNVLAFWILDYRGVIGLATVFWTFFSGSVVPLAILPGGLRTLAELSPFAGMLQVPIDVFLEQQRGLALAGALALQAAWAVLLLAAGRALLGAATRRFVAQGG